MTLPKASIVHVRVSLRARVVAWLAIPWRYLHAWWTMPPPPMFFCEHCGNVKHDSPRKQSRRDASRCMSFNVCHGFTKEFGCIVLMARWS